MASLLGSIYAKLAGALLVLAALLALFLWGHHVGAAGVQTKWDVAKSQQAAVAVNQRAVSAQQTLDWAQQFQGIAAHYETTAHENAPSVADAAAGAVRAGTLRLPAGPAPACPTSGAVSRATVAARVADAAATQALADRLNAAIAALRAGDAADARERQLGQQVTALQALLRAERQQSPAL
jgi:hypothetical protein